jgi:chaperonin GroES
MKPNKQFFLIRIDKQKQTEKRNLLLSEAPYLGIQAAKTKPNKATYGVTIGKVEYQSPAFTANMVVGDTIISVNDIVVHDIHDIIDIVSTKKPGETVEIRYISQFVKLPEPNFKEIVLGRRTTTLYKSLVQEMENNLQYGEIVEIGEEVQKQIPEAAIGDYLIFHHNVEYKERGTGDKTFNDWHLQATLPNGDELRIVKESELFGVLKVAKGIIIPHKNWVFCHSELKKSSFQMHNGLWIPDEWAMKMNEIETKLEEIGLQIKEIQTSTVLSEKTTEQNYRRKEEIEAMISILNKERALLSRQMKQKRLIECKVMFANPETATVIGKALNTDDTIVSDMYALYPLEIGGVQYTLANFTAIEYLINNKTMETKEPKIKDLLPLHDRVFILPHDAEKKTAGGVIIPETAQQKRTGSIVAIGAGIYDKGSLNPTILKKEDNVLFSPMAGTEITLEGKKLLLMRESDIFSSY